MSVTTKIQWCDSTCNPTMGCEGCELWTPKVKKCYAGWLHVRFGGVTKGYSPTFEELTFWPGRMAEAAGWPDLTGTSRKDKPWLDGLPRLIFVSDMSDSLSKDVPFEFLEEEVVRTARSTDGQRHQWLWLTKRPDRMAEFSESLRQKGIDWPSNLWAGTSITTQATTTRIGHLLRVGDQGTIRFLSVEPQHEPIDLAKWLPDLDWIIQGGESGHDACPFQVEWAADLARQCRRQGVAYFLKQLGTVVYRRGEQVHFEDHHGGDWSEWPKELRIREMPLSGQLPAAAGKPAKGKKTQAELSEIARRAWATRRANEKKQQRRDAALKAWATRRKNQRPHEGA
jgi:protein gp37